MRLSNAGKVLQHVLDGKVHGDSRSRVASADQIFKVLVLTDELVLHGVPHHLVEKNRKGNREEMKRHDTTYQLSSSTP